MTGGKAPRAQEQPQLVNNIFVHGYSVKHRELLVGDSLVKFLLKMTQSFHINYVTGGHNLFIGVSMA